MFTASNGHKPVRFHPETEESALVLQVQLGISFEEVVALTSIIGYMVMGKLVESAAQGKGNPRIEYQIHSDDLSTTDATFRVEHTLDQYVQMIADRRHRDT